METFKPEQYERFFTTCEGWDICVTSYFLRDRYLCKIDNVDPGATVARTQGKTREEATKEALRKAGSRLALTRRIHNTRQVLTTMQASVNALSKELEALEQASTTFGQSDPEVPAIPGETTQSSTRSS